MRLKQEAKLRLGVMLVSPRADQLTWEPGIAQLGKPREFITHEEGMPRLREHFSPLS